MKEPFLRNQPAWLQLFSLFGIMILCEIAFSILAFLVIRPLWGINIFTAENLDDFSNPDIISVNKAATLFLSMGRYLVSCVIFSKLVAREGEDYLRIRGKKRSWIFAVMAGMALLSQAPLNFLDAWNRNIDFPSFFGEASAKAIEMESLRDDFINVVLSETSLLVFLVNILVFAIVPAICEEIFFRSVLLRFLFRSSRNIHLTVWIGAAIFSFMHFQFSGFFPRMMMGVLFGYIFMWTGSVWYSVAAHFVNNFIAVLLAWLTARGLTDESINGFGSGENEGIAAATGFILMLLLMYFVKKKNESMALQNEWKNNP